MAAVLGVDMDDVEPEGTMLKPSCNLDIVRSSPEGLTPEVSIATSDRAL